MRITYGMAKCSRCGKDVPYFGKYLFGGELKENELICFTCEFKESLKNTKS